MLCLNEHQARLGDRNPSILTSILPDIVMGIIGFIYIGIILVAECLFCRYLDRMQHGESHTFVPSAVVFIIVSLLACVRGILVKSSSDLFGIFGCGALATTGVALCLVGGILGESNWALVLPSIISTIGLLITAKRRLQNCALVLCREERILRIVEQLVLLAVLIALLVLGLVLFLYRGHRSVQCNMASAYAGSTAGCGLCAAVVLRGRMAVVENRLGSINQRVISWRVDGDFSAINDDVSSSTTP